jgi:hypothetical protein
MFSIGILGFLVWSQLVALPVSDIRVINFTIGWKDYTLLNTFYSSNVNKFVQSAGNSTYIYLLYLFRTIATVPRAVGKLKYISNIFKIVEDKYVERGSSETIRENSFEKFRKAYLDFYGKPFEQNDD